VTDGVGCEMFAPPLKRPRWSISATSFETVEVEEDGLSSGSRGLFAESGTVALLIASKVRIPDSRDILVLV